MIRPAKSVDAWELADIVVDGCARSRYTGVANVDQKLARQMFAQAVQRHGGTTEGSTLLLVNERDGQIDAFIFGTLGRIYTVCDRLASSDVFLLGREGCDPRALRRLFDAYVEWAEANPRVYEIGASWADTIPGGEAITKFYERRGFTLCAKTYRREAVHCVREEAA